MNPSATMSVTSVPVTNPMTRSSGNSMGQSSGFAPTDVGVRTHRFLKALYPRDTAKHVATDTGIPVNTVEKMLERQSAPSAGGYVAMTMAYGTDFLAAVLPNAPGWLDRAVRAERQAALEAQAERIRRELEDLRR